MDGRRAQERAEGDKARTRARKGSGRRARMRLRLGRSGRSPLSVRHRHQDQDVRFPASRPALLVAEVMPCQSSLCFASRRDPLAVASFTFLAGHTARLVGNRQRHGPRRRRTFPPSSHRSCRTLGRYLSIRKRGWNARRRLLRRRQPERSRSVDKQRPARRQSDQRYDEPDNVLCELLRRRTSWLRRDQTLRYLGRDRDRSSEGRRGHLSAFDVERDERCGSGRESQWKGKDAAGGPLGDCGKRGALR